MSSSSAIVHFRQQKLPSGVEIFYRESGERGKKPTLLLLHGFPTSSHLFRHLIPVLNATSAYHIVAPDMPGFGHTVVPPGYTYSFDQLAKSVGDFVDALSLTKYALYIFDYGAPVGLRLALAHPERVTALISQNGNAYEEGLGDAWAPVRALWKADTAENRAALHFICQRPGLDFQYKTGVADLTRLSPDGHTLDEFFLSRPGQLQLQMDLFYDYRKNVQMYPEFQRYIRESKVPVLAVWGDGDPFFVPAGAHAFQKDSPSAVVHIIKGAGHFTLETHCEEIGSEMLTFLRSHGIA